MQKKQGVSKNTAPRNFLLIVIAIGSSLKIQKMGSMFLRTGFVELLIFHY